MADEQMEATLPGDRRPVLSPVRSASSRGHSESSVSLDFEQVPAGSALRGRGDDRARKQKFGVRVVPPPVESTPSHPHPERFGASRASFATSDASLQFVECETPKGKSTGGITPHTLGSEAESLIFQTMPDIPADSAPGDTPLYNKKALNTTWGASELDAERSECQTTQASLHFQEACETSSRGSLQFEECMGRASPPRRVPTPSDTGASSIQPVEVDAETPSMPSLTQLPPSIPSSARQSDTQPAPGRQAAPPNGALASPPRRQHEPLINLAAQPPPPRSSSGHSPPAHTAPPTHSNHVAHDGSAARDSRGRAGGGSAGRESRDTLSRRDRPQWHPAMKNNSPHHRDSAYQGGAFGAPPQAQRGGPIERSGHFAKPREIDQRRLEEGKHAAGGQRGSTMVTL
eukprot:Hpha_TRINITY_DN30501_c0_g1::TRINITY_DN30501_c0_g1_i1::g.193578::m.193578